MKLFQVFRLPLCSFNLFSLTHSLQGVYVGKKISKEENEKREPLIGLWIGGKPMGNVEFDGESFVIKEGKKSIKKIKLSNFINKEQGEIDCTNFLYNHCKTAGKLINEFRYCESYSGKYIEMKVGKIHISCDEQSLFKIEKYEWFYNMVHRYVYRKSGNKHVKLEEEILQIDLKKFIIQRQDGNIFNYRLNNLVVIPK